MALESMPIQEIKDIVMSFNPGDKFQIRFKKDGILGILSLLEMQFGRRIKITSNLPVFASSLVSENWDQDENARTITVVAIYCWDGVIFNDIISDKLEAVVKVS